MKEKNTTVVAVNDKEGDLFVFTCTLDYAVVAKSLDIPKSKLGTCMIVEQAKTIVWIA